MLKAGIAYFAAVFGAGFVLGTFRTLWLLPHLGERAAELVEAPFMLAAIVVAARWIVRRFAGIATNAARLVMGVVALAIVLACELTVVLWLRGMTLDDYFASRDPVAGTVYYAMLAAFAVMPLLAGRALTSPHPRPPSRSARPGPSSRRRRR